MTPARFAEVDDLVHEIARCVGADEGMTDPLAIAAMRDSLLVDWRDHDDRQAFVTAHAISLMGDWFELSLADRETSDAMLTARQLMVAVLQTLPTE